MSEIPKPMGPAMVELIEQLAREYQRHPREGAIHYVQRLQVLAGALPRKEATAIDALEDIKAKPNATSGRLFEAPRLPHPDD